MAVGRTLCLLLASFALTAPALAQTTPAMSGRGAGPSSAGAERWKEHRGEWEARRQAHARQRAADVALLLRLKPDQQGAYQAWEASMRPPEGERGGWKRDGRDEGAAGPMTTAQSLDRMQARMTEREAHMRAHLEATRRFYASLSPEQQGLFDALMRLRHGGGGEERRGHGGPGGPGGPPMMRGEGPDMRDGMDTPPPPPGA